MAFATWAPARRCTGSATPGARSLMKWILDNFKDASSAGIYNCRTVRGGSDTSLHAEGRALDVHFPGKGHKDGHKLVQLLRPIASKLGIQEMIFDRTIWSARSPGKAGRRYTGVNPHFDHVHIGLTRKAGQKLNLATIKALLNKLIQQLKN